jgi:putative ABC transport system permease protein
MGGYMLITAYFSSLNPAALMRAVPGSVAQGLIWGLLALGVYITYKLLDFADLSVDGTIATGGAVAVMLIKSDLGLNPWVALIFSFLAGMIAGLVTGLLHTALGIPPILAGILTQISLYSINLNIMGSSNEAVSVDKYSLVVSSRYLTGDNSTKIKLFAICILFCVAVVAVLYWFFGTELGHAIRATGCNGQMARAQGINTNMCKVLALMLSNGIVGLSGGLYAQYQGAADVNMGRGAIVIGLAAVIIGDVIFGKLCAGKRFSFAYTLFAVISGAIIYYLVLSIVLWLKLPTNDLKLFSAIVVAIFLAVPYLKDKAKASRRA